MKNLKRILLAGLLCVVCLPFCQATNLATNNGGVGYGLDKGAGCALRAITIPITSAPTGSEQSSSDYVIPGNSVVIDAYVNVTTAEATGTTKTISVGTLSSESGGDADGFIAGASISSTGVKQGTLISSGVTLGALLKVLIASSTYARQPYPTGSAARTISYTAGGTDDVEFRGSITVVFYQFQ